jgi:signal peptidase II
MILGMKFDKARAWPFILTGAIILVDQITKLLIVKHFQNGKIFDVFGNGFLRILHVRNPDIAFSLGRNLPISLKPALFVALPLLVLCALLWYYLSSDDFTRLQRWATAGILGGGLGNIIDRIFRRPDGVVDFIDVKFYGLFGFDRWPTFNVADSSVVVCCLLLFASILFSTRKPNAKQAKSDNK